MTKDNLTQDESSTQLKIKDLLIQLKQTFGISFNEIAEQVGVSNTYLSSVFNQKRDGGRQLYAGLLLLKELTVLKQSGVRTNPDLNRELETMRTRIEELQKQISPRYPEQRPDNLALNEKKEKAGGGASSASSGEIAVAVTKLAAAGSKKKSDPHPK